MLGSTDDVIITVLDGFSLHRVQIRSGTWLCHRYTIEPLTAHSRFEIGFDLIGRSGLKDVAGTVHYIVECIRHPTELALEKREAQGVESATAEFFWNIGGKKPHLDGLLFDLIKQFIRNPA